MWRAGEGAGRAGEGVDGGADAGAAFSAENRGAITGAAVDLSTSLGIVGLGARGSPSGVES